MEGACHPAGDSCAAAFEYSCHLAAAPNSVAPMTAPFDPTAYVRAPVITVSSGVSLAMALVDAHPKDASPAAKKALKKLKTTAEAARDALAERNRVLGVFSEEDTRGLDNEADRIWGGFRMGLQALAMLPQDRYPKAHRAAELEAQLFGQGMEFLKADFPTQSINMSAILLRIQQDKLQAEIDALVGPDFLHAAREIQARYETMVSERLRRDKVTGQNFLEMTRGIQAAIVNYATKLVAMADEDEPATIETVRVALLPIANFRAANARDTRATPASPAAPAEPAADAQPVTPPK